MTKGGVSLNMQMVDRSKGDMWRYGNCYCWKMVFACEKWDDFEDTGSAAQFNSRFSLAA